MKEPGVLLIICDGMGDRADRRRNFQTPLCKSEKPSIDALARTGSIGLIDPIAPGVRPGSDVAHFALLGYDPYELYTGRGGLEAVGAGLGINLGDVAFRCNFSTVNDRRVVIDRRAGRATYGREELAKGLNTMKLMESDVSFEFAPTVEHRAVLILRGKGLSRKVTDTDPHTEGRIVQKSMPEDASGESEHTAEILNDFTEKSYQMLKSHPINAERIKRGLPPANIILSRGPGSLPPLQKLESKYSIKTACIGVAPIVRGICSLAGMKLIDVKGATGGLDSDFKAKARAALDAMKENDLVVLHMKAPDVASHNGDFEQKAMVIERIDTAIAEVANSVDLTENYVVLTSDHATPVSVKDHSADPVPLLIAGPDFDASGVETFTERTAAAGNLGRLLGIHLMPIMMNRLGRVEKFGF